jgi:hypothetical protein
MSLNGDLEHFPLVDIIQLLHMTNKTGILRLKSSRGESQLVFHEGFFVGANHLNNSVRIGKVLIDMKAITNDTLNQALAYQDAAGKNRKPLVLTLIEQGKIDKDTAYKGLETLIEMTIVEVLSWKSGTFSFEISIKEVSDEYRYFPENLQMQILLNTQSVLMDSLRIYDEKMREGTLNKLFFAQENGGDNAAFAYNLGANDKTVLCLDALDSMSRKVQDIFFGLKDYSKRDEQSSDVKCASPDTTIAQQEELVEFIKKIHIEV